MFSELSHNAAFKNNLKRKADTPAPISSACLHALNGFQIGCAVSSTPRPI